jgi:hypothetical protein
MARSRFLLVASYMFDLTIFFGAAAALTLGMMRLR